MLKTFLKISVTLTALLLLAGIAFAQTTNTDPQSTVNFSLVACDNRAVVGLNGTMQSGYSVYYQVFDSGAKALTALRRADVSGTYTYLEVVSYDNSAKLAGGAAAYMTVSIARSTDSSRSIYSGRANDIQDGCIEATSTNTSTNINGSNTEATVNGVTYKANSILSPFGGFVNPDYVPAPKPIVTIGAAKTTPPRQATPGVIFAECNQYPVAYPGLLYDTDNVTIFWSWYAKTPELVQEHIDNAVYEIGYFGSNPFMQPIEISKIEKRTANYWVFYTVNLGKVKPGYYTINYRLSWENPISDGFENFGAGTDTERIVGGCDFEVVANPNGTKVQYTFP